MSIREAIDRGDLEALRRLLETDPALARRTLERVDSCGIHAAAPLTYVSLARFHGLARHGRMGEMARLLLAAGAPVNGEPHDKETPLITAASYDEPDVARALIEAGAGLEIAGYAVPNGTALSHAVEFGAPEIVDLLVAAGAHVRSAWEAAGAGAARLAPNPDAAAHALKAAGVCNRLDVIDALLAAGTPVHSLYAGGTALHWAAWEAKAAAARRLVERGADPHMRDPEHGGTPLDWARYRSSRWPLAHPYGHAEVIAFLEP